MWQSFRLGAVYIFCHGPRVGGQQMMKNHYEGDLSRRMHDFHLWVKYVNNED